MKKYILTLIIFAAFLIRLVSINQSFWLDETTSGYVARDLSFGEIIFQFSPADFHPPLYYLILKVWGQLFGYGEIALRMFSVILSIATIYVVYLIGKILNKKSGLGTLSAALIATSGLFIYYSQEARMYIMETFFVSLSVLLFLLILKKDSFLYWLAFSLCLVLIGATDYLPLFILPVFWIIAWRRKKKGFVISKLILAHVPLILFFFWWWPTLSRQLDLGTSVLISNPKWWDLLGRTTIKNFLLVPVKFVLGRISFYNKMTYALAAIPALLLYAFAFSRSLIKNNLVTNLWFFIPLILAFILGFKLSVFSYFRLLFILPAFYLMVAKGTLSLSNPLKTILVTMLMLINLVSSFYYLASVRLHREDWRGLVAHANANSSENSVLILPGDTQMEGFRYYRPEIKYIAASEYENKYSQIWLVRYLQPVFDPTDRIRLEMEMDGYNKQSEHDFNGVVVWKYTK
jgi:uncharacterized membrane protein